MLSAEQARERLEALRVTDWRERRVADLSGLPPHLREIGLALLDVEEEAQDQTSVEMFERIQRRWGTILKAAETLDEQSPADRVRLFQALFPHIGIYAAHAWELAKRLPYQTDQTRKAFRAPRTPVTSLQARASWLWSLLTTVEGYDQDIRWFAIWAPYLGWNAPHTLGLLLAAAIETESEEGKEVFEILRASATGEHEIGAMGRHVIRAMLIASRPEGWSLMERLLLAAQRQEGLRQAILESVDEAHPEAFRRFLRIILEHDLVRFSSVIRAVNVWFGFGWPVENVREVKNDLKRTLEFLEDPSARQQALRTGEGRAVYLALWSIAFEDIMEVLEPAERLLKDPDVERRFAAVYLLSMLEIWGSQKLLRYALDDPDWRVVAWALRHLIPKPEWDDFERLEKLNARLSRAMPPAAILWPWCRPQINRRMIADRLIDCLGSRPPARLIPHLPHASPSKRRTIIDKLGKIEAPDSQIRRALLGLFRDPSPQVRQRAFEIFMSTKQPLLPEEILELEDLLSRKAGDLRQNIIKLLLAQSDPEVLASAQRLISSKHPWKRRAGIELLRQMVENGRALERAAELIREYSARTPQLPEEESRLLQGVLLQLEPPVLENALGLMDPAQRTPPAIPHIPERPWILQKPSTITHAAMALIRALDEWIYEHRFMPVILPIWKSEELLGNVGWKFPWPNPSIAREKDLAHMPLREWWEAWWQNRPADLRDADGLELLRALAALFSLHGSQQPSWAKKVRRRLFGDVDQQPLRYEQLVHMMLRWQLRSHSPENAVDFLLDAVEFTLALIREETKACAKDFRVYDWRSDFSLLAWLELARVHQDFWPEQWSAEHHIRLWRLLRWMDEPAPEAPRRRPALEEILYALRAGGATEADLLDYLLGPREPGQGFYELYFLSGRVPHRLAQEYPILKDAIERCRKRIIEIEQSRGELPTAASRPACFLRYSGGMEVLIRLLQAMGPDNLIHRRAFNDLSRPAVLSHLIRVTFPSETDTPESFARRISELRIPWRRLIELAIFAPQWARHVEHALGWPGLEEAAWWIHAHTKDRHWNIPDEIRDAWRAEISERTPLSAEDLLDGAVDVAWFQKAYHSLGPERWSEIYAAAKYASGSSGHRRAQLYADALLGRMERQELIRRIREKRNLDAVRALGLLPLADGEARDQDLLERYQLLQEFIQTGKQFGATRREKEQRAVAIAMQNLARTAGYADPLRLQWAMEMKEVQDLKEGPLILTRESITITLEINDEGEPRLTIHRDHKPLKNIPAHLKKDPQVVQLLVRKQSLEKQVSRIRTALEQAMCRGDYFLGAELQTLMEHPILRPMLQQLVFIIESSPSSGKREAGRLMGYPVQEGKALQFHDGRLVPIAKNDRLRIAHPFDMFSAGEWHLWQRECFLMERIQPFKQVFRELYLLTSVEKVDGTFSRRYSGHQVQPRQAMALLNQRGWVYSPGEGVRRTFHDHNLSAWVTFLEAPFTPVEVELLTIDTVFFTRRGEWEPLALEEVPPRLFSEVMRDLDLVVSVAHAGGVDPEATASTIEMRAALIRETCAMLNLTNVQLQGSHALIHGQLNSYSVHLGSGVVHRQPGGAVCIVPVHGQHRGRLFLPFADDDPKTAEVLSKVLLLARDSEIKDPTILEQLLA